MKVKLMENVMVRLMVLSLLDLMRVKQLENLMVPLCLESTLVLLWMAYELEI